jgi:hypothetical protein
MQVWWSNHDDCHIEHSVNLIYSLLHGPRQSLRDLAHSQTLILSPGEVKCLFQDICRHFESVCLSDCFPHLIGVLSILWVS